MAFNLDSLQAISCCQDEVSLLLKRVIIMLYIICGQISKKKSRIYFAYLNLLLLKFIFFCLLLYIESDKCTQVQLYKTFVKYLTKVLNNWVTVSKRNCDCMVNTDEIYK